MKANTSMCVSYFINSIEDTELTIDVASGEYKQVKTLAVVGEVGEVEKMPVIGAVHIF